MTSRLQTYILKYTRLTTDLEVIRPFPYIFEINQALLKKDTPPKNSLPKILISSTVKKAPAAFILSQGPCFRI